MIYIFTYLLTYSLIVCWLHLMNDLIFLIWQISHIRYVSLIFSNMSATSLKKTHLCRSWIYCSRYSTAYLLCHFAVSIPLPRCLTSGIREDQQWVSWDLLVTTKPMSRDKYGMGRRSYGASTLTPLQLFFAGHVIVWAGSDWSVTCGGMGQRSKRRSFIIVSIFSSANDCATH